MTAVPQSQHRNHFHRPAAARNALDEKQLRSVVHDLDSPASSGGLLRGAPSQLARPFNSARRPSLDCGEGAVARSGV